jgi:hypothetical protein
VHDTLAVAAIFGRHYRAHGPVGEQSMEP